MEKYYNVSGSSKGMCTLQAMRQYFVSTSIGNLLLFQVLTVHGFAVLTGNEAAPPPCSATLRTVALEVRPLGDTKPLKSTELLKGGRLSQLNLARTLTSFLLSLSCHPSIF